MASPSNTLKTGHYVGNGSATKRVFKMDSIEPRIVRIQSVRGQAYWNERAPGAFKILDSAVPSVLAASALAVEKDLGFAVSSTDATLNENGVDYYWEAY